MKNYYLLSSLLLLLTFLTIGSSVTAETQYPKELVSENVKFYLYSEADFDYLFMDIYSVALYLDRLEPETTVLDPKIGKLLFFKYHRKIGRDRIINGAVEALKKNPAYQFADFQTEVEKFNRYYQDVQKGDSYLLTYLPDAGLSLAKDQKQLVQINKPGFSDYYLGIWLSDTPLSTRIRNKLLKK